MENNKLQSINQPTEVTFQIPNTESLGQLKDMREDFSLTMKYRTADDWAALKGQEVRAYYMGLRGIPNEDGEIIQCGIFVTENECFLSGQLTLVEAVKQLLSGTAVSIVYEGKRNNKSSDGSTMIFKVSTLR